MDRLETLDKIDQLSKGHCRKCPHNNEKTLKNCQACPVFAELNKLGESLKKPRKRVGELLDKGYDMKLSEIDELREMGITLQEIADAMGISKPKLEGILKQRREKPLDKNLPKAKKLLEGTNKTYKSIAKETGVNYATVAYHGKKIRDKKVTDKPKQTNKTNARQEEIKTEIKRLKTELSKTESEVNNWKENHDDLMEKYKKERERNEKLEELNGKWNKQGAILANQVKGLEEKLEAYEANENPNMVAKLSESNAWKDEEIQRLHRQTNRADQERDEAMKYAQELKDQLQERMRDFKEYEIEYEDRYKNMKAQRDHYAAVAQLQLEVSG
ncbi:hypothetical protein [Halobacillus karajensis]|uniref:Uncharacterized protein n=1 Tax=Halobacillus karajensis TaxID=195088 RepID=A0A059NXT6_9BACI|nr:hypothetical protein [Halobacillus karajensis]CDQ22606.1 hypothetical protein BN983_00819 [Halobacillus karajensis]CDQ26088.1 hypothetical protein BN981_00299 [Halobacillus karajensis]